MKKAILLLLTFSLRFIINAQTVDEYVEYIQEQGKDPKDLKNSKRLMSSF